MEDPLRDGESLVAREFDGLAVFDVDQQLTVKDQEELVAVVMLVSMKVALDDAKPHRCVIDRREGLVRPRIVLGGFGATSIGVSWPNLSSRRMS